MCTDVCWHVLMCTHMCLSNITTAEKVRNKLCVPNSPLLLQSYYNGVCATHTASCCQSTTCLYSSIGHTNHTHPKCTSHMVCLLCSDVFWYVLMCGDVYWCVLMCADVYSYVLMCTDVYWCVLMCTHVCWHLLICADVYWCVLMCTDVYWCVLICPDVYWCVLLCTQGCVCYA